MMYCNNCGKKVSGKKCSNCKTNAKIKNTLFGDYIFDIGGNEAKDKFSGALFDKIQYLIRKYLYGIVFSIMVVGTVIVAVNVNQDKDVIVVDTKPEIVFEKQEYKSLEDIYNALTNALTSGSDFKKLLLSYSYPDLAKEYNTKIEESKLFELNKNGIFTKDYMKFYSDGYDEPFVVKVEDSICVASECIDYSMVDYPIYDYILGMTYINPETDEFLGKFEFYVDFVEIDGNYYILGILDVRIDHQLEDTNADIDKIDMDIVNCLYVNYDETNPKCLKYGDGMK